MRPHADELIPYMPADVLDEFRSHDPDIEGFTPLVKQWITTSKIEFVEKWVERLRVWAALQYKQALREQLYMSELASQLYAGEKGRIKRRAVLHPVFKQHHATINGRQTWHDPEALADTVKQAPKLFIK